MDAVAAADPLLGKSGASPATRGVTWSCTGGFLLAASGLLDGRRATTHWYACDMLDSTYPSLTVAPDAIYAPRQAVAAETADGRTSAFSEDHGNRCCPRRLRDADARNIGIRSRA
jgi:hypothetical protein